MSGQGKVSDFNVNIRMRMFIQDTTTAFECMSVFMFVLIIEFKSSAQYSKTSALIKPT
jgi:hypothetical protein